jgi:hypothetical protein
VNPTVDQIYRQKQQRRRVLAQLSLREKVEIIEQLRDLAMSMKDIREIRHQRTGVSTPQAGGNAKVL